MFGAKKKPIALAKNARCMKCGKRIKDNSRYTYVNGKLYCEQCAKRKKDLDLLSFMMIFDDD